MILNKPIVVIGDQKENFFIGAIVHLRKIY